MKTSKSHLPRRQLVLPRPVGFDLHAARDFYRDFVPGSGMAAASTPHPADSVAGARLTFALRADATFAPYLASVSQTEDTLVVDAIGDVSEGAMTAQIARMLGLDA